MTDDRLAKVRRIREYARKLGLCPYCFVRERAEGRKKCSNCTKSHNRSIKKLRQNPKRCSRCGQLKTAADLKAKTCLKCRGYAKNYYSKNK
jgi:hypothetical protein